MNNKPKIILDVDTGTDDSVMIMLAVLSKKFNILGITTTWGNQKVEDTTKNTLKLLSFLNSKIPVYKGCNEAMAWTYDEARAKNHIGNQISYIDDKGKEHHLHPKNLPLPATKRKAEDKHAVRFIIDTCVKSQDKITLVAVGPCTNLGMAFKLEPNIKQHINQVVFMGGSDGTGNVTPTAEANFWNDPEAIKIIFESGVKCVVGSLNATMSIPLTIEEVDYLGKMKAKAARKAAEICKIRMDVSKHLGWNDGSYDTVHDPIAITYLLDKKIVTKMIRKDGDIHCGGPLDGTLILKDNPKGNVYFIYEVDKQKYFDLYKTILATY